jgi:hypothetical protein
VSTFFGDLNRNVRVCVPGGEAEGGDGEDALTPLPLVLSVGGADDEDDDEDEDVVVVTPSSSVRRRRE